MVTSGSPVPEEIHHGQQIRRNDLVSYYEEADYMIPQQLTAVVVANESAVVKVLSADTDVFVLLCAHLWKCKWYLIKLYMDTFSNDRDKLISINKTV